MADIDEYLKGILSQILTSHKILTELDDEPNDLETIKKELSKIRGLLQVIHNKLDEKKYQTDHLVQIIFYEKPKFALKFLLNIHQYLPNQLMIYTVIQKV